MSAPDRAARSRLADIRERYIEAMRDDGGFFPDAVLYLPYLLTIADAAEALLAALGDAKLIMTAASGGLTMRRSPAFWGSRQQIDAVHTALTALQAALGETDG